MMARRILNRTLIASAIVLALLLAASWIIGGQILASANRDVGGAA